MENPLINLSNKLQRAFNPQGHKTCNTSTYSHQGPCTTLKILMPSPGEISQALCYMPGSVSLLFWETNLSSLPTLCERTRFRAVGPCGESTLPSMHSLVSIVGNREKRWLGRKGTDYCYAYGRHTLWRLCRRSSRGQLLGRVNSYTSYSKLLLLVSFCFGCMLFGWVVDRDYRDEEEEAKHPVHSWIP